ncbi:uncharacterized protein FIBRA_00683 [Fibroporia radiculosa]|uniref:Probable succinyl-diaminopimelate desuccinylase n=1 Tax=Fibroporia radiculosa TaxID=599839 RepID=J4I827_9APHY|nr:uncharacterized protein FIBRA_00683 [Fibroporia radiculosa]CCL98681.1 predicted protein [Fibroporia radiculosa]
MLYRNPCAVTGALPSLLPLDPRITAFHEQLPGYKPTPLRSLPRLAQELGIGQVLLKDESVRLGLPAFKILGASWATYRAIIRYLGLSSGAAISLEELARACSGKNITLIAATDGNHGRAVARMANLLGVSCVVYIPKGLDVATRELIAGEGARVLETQGDYDHTVLQASEAACALKGGILIQDTAFEGYTDISQVRLTFLQSEKTGHTHLYAYPPLQWIVDGYSTMFTELDEQTSQLAGSKHADVVIVPVGVGSLAQAVVTHYKRSGRINRTSIVTAEPDTAACLNRSLRNAQTDTSSGAPAGIPTSSTIMTGLNCGTVSPLAWPLLSNGVDVSASVADIEAHSAGEYLRSEGVNIGPCAAAPLAALRQLVAQPDGLLTPDSVVVLLATEGPRPYPTPLDTTTTDPVALTQILTRIDSSNPDLSAGAGAGETAIADYLCAWLAHHEFEVHRLEAHEGRPSVIGVARGSGGGKALMFNGHIDTVTLAGYDGDPLSGAIIDGAVHGRGTFDMKAGIAASLVAAYRAKERQTLRGDVILALVADEENLSLGTQEVLAAGWRADGAVVSEPTEHGLMLSHKGFVWAEVDIIGKAGHGSRPDLAIDAIAKAGHFLVALEKYGEELLHGQKSVPHPHLGTGTVHASLIKGGEEISSYPALCTVSIERRTVPGETPALFEQQIQEVLDGLCESVQDFKYKLRLGDSRPPYEIREDHEFVKLFAKHVKNALGEDAEMTGATYWADSALLAEKGIPVVLFGAQGRGAHAATEWATVDSIHKVTGALTGLALEFCA